MLPRTAGYTHTHTSHNFRRPPENKADPGQGGVDVDVLSYYTRDDIRHTC